MAKLTSGDLMGLESCGSPIDVCVDSYREVVRNDTEARLEHYCNGPGKDIGNSLYSCPTFPVVTLVQARVRQPTELPNSLVDK